jgi:hypothetical protein
MERAAHGQPFLIHEKDIRMTFVGSLQGSFAP